MIFKPGIASERSWRKLRSFDWLARAIEGARFRDGREASENTNASAHPQLASAAA
jgi:hypothetical protein